MILGVCASIIPFPDHNQVNISLGGHQTLSCILNLLINESFVMVRRKKKPIIFSFNVLYNPDYP